MHEDDVKPRKRRRRFASLEAATDNTSDSSPIPHNSIDSPRLRFAPSWPACRSVEHYERLNFIDEGTYGRVYRAREIETGRIYAMKQLKVTQERDGFPVTSLREVSALFTMSHPNVVALKEVVLGLDGHSVYMVLEYAAHDVHSLLDRMRRPYSPSEVKSLMLQLLRGVEHLHHNWLMHRDLKPANLLLTDGGVLKICDFGLARTHADGDSRCTPGVVTLWYRAPEILFADPHYTCAVDMWAVGCIFAELILMKPLFQSQGELGQLRAIADLLGPPSEAVWRGFNKLPNAERVRIPYQQKFTIRERLMPNGGNGGAYITSAGISLIEKMLTYDPLERISAEQAIEHRYFKESPPPKDPALIQTFPDDRRG